MQNSYEIFQKFCMFYTIYLDLRLNGIGQMNAQNNFRKFKKCWWQVVVYFDMNLPIILTVDASSYRLVAVAAHKLSDGSEKSIANASRTVSECEEKYAQIEKRP